MIALVVAHSENRVIGRDGGLPWHLPSDMRHFKEVTAGRPVIMGRKTYESIPERFRPLPGRRNIVLSANGFTGEGAEVFGDLAAALAAGEGDRFVIGGGEIYRQALPHADRVHATVVEGVFDGDTFFPDLLDAEWECVQAGEPQTENGHTFRFCTYDRR
jgi:dihydrofolate reductase